MKRADAGCWLLDSGCWLCERRAAADWKSAIQSRPGGRNLRYVGTDAGVRLVTSAATTIIFHFHAGDFRGPPQQSGFGGVKIFKKKTMCYAAATGAAPRTFATARARELSGPEDFGDVRDGDLSKWNVHKPFLGWPQNSH